jgi:DNA-binding transcriptional LysR family regulator
MRATSAVSYSIANLEQHLGVVLFDRERTRKPTLTEVGMAILSDATATKGLWRDSKRSANKIVYQL